MNQVGLKCRTLHAPQKGLIALVVVAAGYMACSDPEVATQRAFVFSSVTTGLNSTNCGLASGPWIEVGEAESPIDNGASYRGVPVKVECSVHQTGNAFDVRLFASVGGVNSGSVLVQQTGLTSQGPNTVKAEFRRTDTTGSTPFAQTDCTLTFDAATNDRMGVFPGRLWGRLDCPQLAKTDEPQRRVCTGFAELRFENCDQ